MKCALFIETNTAMSSWGTTTEEWTEKSTMTAVQAFSWVCDEFKCSVNKSECLDDLKPIDH